MGKAFLNSNSRYHVNIIGGAIVDACSKTPMVACPKGLYNGVSAGIGQESLEVGGATGISTKEGDHGFEASNGRPISTRGNEVEGPI